MGAAGCSRGGPGGGGRRRARRPRRRGSGAPPASPADRTGSGRRSPPPLADDVASEPDPRPAGELEAEAGRFRDGGREAGGQAGRLEGDEERLRPAGEGRGRADATVGDLGGGRAGVRARRQVDDEQVDRSAGEQRPGNREALVERVRRQDDEPVEADAAGDGLDRVEGAGEVQPGDDRAVGLGLRGEAEGEGRLARAGVAAQGDAGAPGQPTGTEDRVERGEAGPDDDPFGAARGRELGGRSARPARGDRGVAAPAPSGPAPRRPAELPLPSAPGGTPEPPTRPGRGPPSDAD